MLIRMSRNALMAGCLALAMIGQTLARDIVTPLPNSSIPDISLTCEEVIYFADGASTLF
jgi:hypothetical protein